VIKYCEKAQIGGYSVELLIELKTSGGAWQTKEKVE
jgi:hypothetical protein